MKKVIILGLIIFLPCYVFGLEPKSVTNQLLGTGNDIIFNDVTVATDLDVGGTANLDEVDIDGATDISAALTLDGEFIMEAPSIVQLGSSTALGVYDSFVLVVGSDTAGVFAMTSDASAFISTDTAIVTQGQEITVMGTDAVGTVTLTDGTGCIELDGSSVTLGLGSNIKLIYYAGKWYQSGGINTID